MYAGLPGFAFLRYNPVISIFSPFPITQEAPVIHEIRFDVDSPSLRAEQLDKLVGAYLADCRRRVQPVTVKGYRFKLRAFVDWWLTVGPATDWILSANDLAEYEQWLLDLGWGYGSRHDAVKRLRQMFRWAQRAGYVPVDFGVFVPKVRGSTPARLPLSLDALAAMLQACWRMAYPIRNRAIIAVLAGTALRREEAASIMIDDVVVHADGAGYIQPSVTKNDKARIVAFDAATGSYLSQWLDLLDMDSGPLFPSRKGGKAISPGGLYKAVTDAARLAGVSVETHDLRRLFATTWARALKGESYNRLLQVQMGHAEYATTVIYTLQQVDEVLDVLRSAPVSPIARLNAL